MTAAQKIGIGLMGLGVVGSGVVRVLTEKAETLAAQVGCPLELRRILVRDPGKPRTVAVSPTLLTTSAADLLADAGIDIIVEVMGGDATALDCIRAALERGKHVVTANKEVMAKHGPELLSLAAEHQVGLRFEASVGGGIPLIAPFQDDLAANDITAIRAIINGTTNYILTRMAQDGLDFATALRQAQELGYAEADPTYDVEGIDAAYKLAILASLAFYADVRAQHVYHEGISRLASRDFRYARELGYTIKLLAIARKEGRAIQVRVHPAFVPNHLLLAKVDGVFNAVEVEGDLTGRVIFYGRGAGSLPTASAVVADVIKLAHSIARGVSPRQSFRLESGGQVRPIAEIETRYYLRMTVTDRPGVLAQIAHILGDHNISIASVIQKEADDAAQTAEIVIMTHPAREEAVQRALRRAEQLDVVSEISNFVRVED